MILFGASLRLTRAGLRDESLPAIRSLQTCATSAAKAAGFANTGATCRLALRQTFSLYPQHHIVESTGPPT
jgi:hypothetical protein